MLELSRDSGRYMKRTILLGYNNPNSSFMFFRYCKMQNKLMIECDLGERIWGYGNDGIGYDKSTGGDVKIFRV